MSSDSRLRIVLALAQADLRHALGALLRAEPGFELVEELSSLAQAPRRCASSRPQAVVLGGEPGEALQAIGEIMARSPVPILLLTSQGAAVDRYQAIAAGALEVLEAPTVVDRTWSQALAATLRMLARIKVITHIASNYTARSRARAARAAATRTDSRGRRLVAIGASTGGPVAVAKILSALPAQFPLPVLLVIHTGGAKGDSPASWLKLHCPLPVSSPVDGERMPEPGEGRVLVAPAGVHMLVRNRRLWLSEAPERHSCRPSIDVLFESVAAEFGAGAIGCLLTGMGRDGADGLLAIARAGGVTLAQDEKTSVVFGMPKAAIELGAAQTVLALPEIAPSLVELAGWRAEVKG